VGHAFDTSELRKAFSVAEQLLRLAHNVPEQELTLDAQSVVGHATFWMGEFLPAREHLEMAISLYDTDHQRPRMINGIGFDAGVFCLSCAAATLWQLGYADQALKRGNEALALARRLTHSHSLAFAELFVGYLCQFRREVGEAQETAANLNALSAEFGLTQLGAIGKCLAGWAMAAEDCFGASGTGAGSRNHR
jgi:adenylate cyclase